MFKRKQEKYLLESRIKDLEYQIEKINFRLEKLEKPKIKKAMKN